MKNKTTAGLLAFFLGAFGIHRFYLGQWGLGIFHLVFCWAYFPAVIAIIDAIVFLTMKEEIFNAKYNPGVTLMPQQQPTIVINNTTAAGNVVTNQTTHDKEVNNLTKIATRKKQTPKKDPFEIKGDNKYEDYDFDGALSDFLRSLNVRSQNPAVHFKVACLYSILEKNQNVFFHLSKAVEQGFYDFDRINTHDHLAYIRAQQPDFDNFIAGGYQLQNKQSAPSDTLNIADDIISRIEKLAALKDKGIISEEEFQGQKTKLLNG